MLKLSALRQDTRAIAEGEWVPVGEDYDDLEVKVRGFTDAYHDDQMRMQRRAARDLGIDVGDLPTARRRAINIECLCKHVLVDVRNLSDDDGQVVTVDALRDLLREPDYAPLVVAVFAAASRVGQRRAAALDAAVGNSAPPSAGS